MDSIIEARKRNNIVICANDVTQIGGISRVIHSMAEGFSKQGYSVSLLGMNSIASENSYEDESNQSVLYPTAIAYTDNPPPRNKDFNRWNRMRGEAVGYMRRFFDGMDISDTILITLHVYVMEHLLETGVKIGGEDGLAVLGMYHNSFESCKMIGDLKRVKQSYSQATRFFALTEKDRDSYAAEGLTNASYIYNPVELLSEPIFKPISEREKRVIYVGRFAKEKRVPELVEAWSRVADKYPDWRFDIYGVGPDENEIAKSILTNRVSGSVRLLGKTQKPEQELANSRLMLMASDFEGLPVVIVEAGLVGTPTLSTDCAPGISVLIKDKETGELVKDKGFRELAERLDYLLANQDELDRYSVNAQVHMQQFSVERITSEWEDYFKQLNLI